MPKTITLTLRKELIKELKHVSKNEYRTMSAVATIALENYFKKKREKNE